MTTYTVEVRNRATGYVYSEHRAENSHDLLQTEILRDQLDALIDPTHDETYIRPDRDPEIRPEIKERREKGER